MALTDKVKRQKPVAEKLFKIFQEHATSVRHATQACEIMEVVIDAAKRKAWKDKHIRDLNFMEEMGSEEEMKDRPMYEAIVTLFDGTTIEDAQEILQGMQRAIDMNMLKKVKELPMSEVDAKQVF